MQLPGIDTLKRFVRKRRDTKAISTWSEKDQQRQDFYAQFIRPADIVFDVGANVGNRAKIFSRLAGRVVLFEPQPYCLDVLKTGFAGDAKIAIVPKALGRSPGMARIMTSDAHTVSSMSTAWIDAVRSSGRFSQIRWNREIEVAVTTLDAAIEDFGEPAFIKIDVEGYEPEVLAGLSRPIAALSLEFTPEHLESMRQCMEKLSTIGKYEYNLSLGESMVLALEGWQSADEVLGRLGQFGVTVFGDVYARRIMD